MADIKLKKKPTIKKIDKAVVNIQKIKENSIEIKDRERKMPEEEQSPVDYSVNRIKEISLITKDKGINEFKKLGSNSISKSNKNLKLAKEKINNFKVRKKENNFIENNKKFQLKNPKFIKTKSTTYKENISNTINFKAKKISNNAIFIIKEKTRSSVKAFKRLVKGLKTTFSGLKAINTFIIAGSFISIIIILVVCILCGAMAIFNSNGDDDTSSLWKGNIVNIAKSQIGVTGGDPYWSWYGFNERVEWCACFVSWCAEQCNYYKENKKEDFYFPKYSYCDDGINAFKEHNEWKDRNEDYIPKFADIIFFDWEKDGISDHTGIVEGVDFENKKVKTIEGNSNDEVKENEYTLTDDRIVGYGTPIY